MSEDEIQGQQLEQQGEAPEAPATGPPNADQFEDYEEFLTAKIRYDVKEATQANAERAAGVLKEGVRDGVAQAIGRPQLDLPDDEYRSQRVEAARWRDEYLDKSAKAKLAGDEKKAAEFAKIAEFKGQELAALGPSKAEQVVDHIKWANTFRGVSNLGESSLDSHPVWNHPRMAHDSAVLIHQQNRNSKEHIVVLPREKSEYGELETIRPSKMVFLQLDPKTYDSFVHQVYQSGGPEDSDSLFRRSWAVLHREGLAHSAEPTIKYPKPEVDAEPEEETPRGRDPWSRMTQREFEAAMSKRPNMVKR